MQCPQVQELLSAFHDGELGPQMRKLVEAHLGQCSACTQRLGEIKKTSLASQQLEPPNKLWEKLKEQLDQEFDSKTKVRSDRWRAVQSRPVALISAAAIVLAVVAALLWLQGRHDHGHSEDTFGHFLVEYRKHPDEAQHQLTAKYQGRQVDLREAEREARFCPVATAALPGQISLKSVYLLKMPCCLCVQSIYERPDKGLLMLLEHEEEQPQWFGNRPAINATCNGKPASVVQCDGELAVTWKSDKRFVTIVGARDLEEVTRFVTFLDNRDKDAEG